MTPAFTAIPLVTWSYCREVRNHPSRATASAVVVAVRMASRRPEPGLELQGHGTLTEAVTSDALETGVVLVPDLKALAVSLVRDLRGNPFRPAVLDPLWRTCTVA